jgi:hypothetical protein
MEQSWVHLDQQLSDLQALIPDGRQWAVAAANQHPHQSLIKPTHNRLQEELI